MSSSPEQLHKFISVINQLKQLERFKDQVYWRDYPTPVRWESVADHSWRLALLVIMFADRLSGPFNLEKALKMAIIHDIPEIIAGDASPLGETGTGKDSHAYNDKVKAKRHIDEKEAARQIFSLLDPEDEVKLFDAWLETETQSSYEARVVKSLDKIEAMLQVLEWRDGHMFKSHLEFTTTYGSKGSDVDPAIREFADYIATEMRGKFKEFLSTSKKAE